MYDSVNATVKLNTLLDEKLLKPQEVANYLGVSKSKAYQLMRSQGFPAFRIGKHFRTDPALLKEWVRKQK